MHAHKMEPSDPPGHAPVSGNFHSEPETIHFGAFCVVPASRLLLHEGREVLIGGRAFDLLMALLQARGHLIDKNEIVRKVWPSTTVEECNIRFQIGTLRKILGSDGDLIKTIPGRGYLMVEREPDKARLQLNPTPPSPRGVPLPDWLRSSLPGRIRSSDDRDDGPYVVLVDDDATVLEALASLVRSAGFRVQAFPSTNAFLNSDQTSPPGCMVLDAWMPGQGGLDFQASLLRAGVHLPIVFISGHADIAMSVRAIKAGALDFLTKPVRYDDLLGAIHHAMAEAVTVSEPGRSQSVSMS